MNVVPFNWTSFRGSRKCNPLEFGLLNRGDLLSARMPPSSPWRPRRRCPFQRDTARAIQRRSVSLDRSTTWVAAPADRTVGPLDDDPDEHETGWGRVDRAAGAQAPTRTAKTLPPPRGIEEESPAVAIAMTKARGEFAHQESGPTSRLDAAFVLVAASSCSHPAPALQRASTDCRLRQREPGVHRHVHVQSGEYRLARNCADLRLRGFTTGGFARVEPARSRQLAAGTAGRLPASVLPPSWQVPAWPALARHLPAGSGNAGQVPAMPGMPRQVPAMPGKCHRRIRH